MKSTPKKYPGALPMVYAAIDRDRNGKPVSTSRDHCPRPLSRYPCFVPYAELPEQQRLKDEMFGLVVRAVLAQ